MHAHTDTHTLTLVYGTNTQTGWYIYTPKVKKVTNILNLFPVIFNNLLVLG